jgi:DNA gyrase subunit A
MSVLNHIDATPEERDAYMRAAGQVIEESDEPQEQVKSIELPKEKFQEMLAKEQLLLTVTNKGFGKRTSSYEYRITGRGGQGVTNMNLTAKNGGEVVATFPVTDNHQIMLVTDKGKLIRTPVKDVRITGRSAQGVTIFRTADDEKVVSVAWLIEEENGDAPGEEAEVGAEPDEKE